MKENYQKRMENIINELKGRPKLLLHACCAPCATYVTECLMPHFDITLYYYNPNTHPRDEYLKRLEALNMLALAMGLPVLEGEYNQDAFFLAAEGLEEQPEGGARCAECFKLRLYQTASAAKKGAFDMFATTLTVSPHKNAELINSIGFEAEQLYGAAYLPSDFKKRNGFKRSTELSQELGLYRQSYCGCEFSIR